MSSGFMPELKSMAMFCTVMRVPAMRGCPPQVPGVSTIKVPISMAAGMAIDQRVV